MFQLGIEITTERCSLQVVPLESRSNYVTLASASSEIAASCQKFYFEGAVSVLLTLERVTLDP